MKSVAMPVGASEYLSPRHEEQKRHASLVVEREVASIKVVMQTLLRDA